MFEKRPTIALFSWGNALEDFLEPLGVSLETFLNEFRGSWMFGYIHALNLVDVRTVLFFVSNRVAAPLCSQHVPTGATVYVLPTPRIYRILHRRMIYPYGQTVREMFGDVRGFRRLAFPLLALLREVALYPATPLGLFTKILRQEGCKVILCQEYEYPRFDVCVLLGKLMRLPVFATFQGGNYQHSRIERLLRPLTIRACAGLIIAARAEAERVDTRYRVSTAKLAKIFNPVDLNVWRVTDRDAARASLGIPSDARVVAWHGRVSLHKKGLDILLDVWQRICHERDERQLRLILVGTGDDVQEVSHRISTLRLQNVLWINQFVHDPTDVRRYLAAADVYAFPSRYEGFPVAPIEAMACGLPIVAADADGVSDILENGEASGGLVVPCDNTEEFAIALARLIDSGDWCYELGRYARRRVEAHFSPQTIGEQLRTFLLGSSSTATKVKNQGDS